MNRSQEGSPSPDAEEGRDDPRRRVLRGLKSLLLTVLFIGSSIWAYNAIASALAHRWDAAQERDEATGVLLGAEPLILGPPKAETAILLVHGFIGASTNFGDLPERLAEAGYRVHALRLPGHGTTPFDLLQTPASDMLDAVLLETRLLKKLHTQVYLVGHSMGGTLSALAASEEPVDGLILAAPYFRVSSHWYYILRPETWSNLTNWALKWAYKGDGFIRVNRREAKDEIVSYRWVPSNATREAGGLARRARDPQTLGKIDCPVLLLHSPDDFAASPKAAEQAFKNIASKKKTLVWLENSDHHLFWDHDREEAIAAVLEFIEGHTPP